MSIQTTTYKRRLREHSGLKPLALLIALTIADLRWEAKRKQHEPLPLTLQEIADACGMSRRTASDHLNECIRSGWIVGRRVFRDGRQKPNEYFISDPTAPDTECRRLHSVIASGGEILSADAPRNVRRRLHTVVRSNNNGASDTAPQSAGAESDEQGQPETVRDAEPVPALEGAGPEPADESAVLDAWQEQHRDSRAGQCRHCGHGHAIPSGYGLYDGRSNDPRPRLMECSHCGLPWPKPRLNLVPAS